MMDAGGSPFPHNEGASVNGGTEVATGTAVSIAFSSDPKGGSSILGPISLGSASGNVIIPLYGTSGMLVSHHHCFLEQYQSPRRTPIHADCMEQGFSLLSFGFLLLLEEMDL